MADTPSGKEEECLECLDRAVNEVEALRLIYNTADDDDYGETNVYDESNGTDTAAVAAAAAMNDGHDHVRVSIRCTDAIKRANEMLLAQARSTSTASLETVPTLELQLDIENGSAGVSVCLYVGLVPGYPSFEPAIVRVLTATTSNGGIFTKRSREELTSRLQEKAHRLVGLEAVMELVQECQEYLQQLEWNNNNNNKCENTDNHEKKDNSNEETATTETMLSSGPSPSNTLSQQQLGRRWIWVHHIKDKQRKEDIVREARAHGLGGYLKAGYPGIVVVEGSVEACNEFVSWIKGNKSRPGGFGRNWGHHVRGELVINHRRLPETFEELEEDMSVLASSCRADGVEEEFLKFVLQHG